MKSKFQVNNPDTKHPTEDYLSVWRYTNDTTLMAESEEELKSLLRKVKAESESLS